MDLESGERIWGYVSIIIKSIPWASNLTPWYLDFLVCLVGTKVSTLSRLSLGANETTHMHAFINRWTSVRLFLGSCTKNQGMSEELMQISEISFN